jgi:hypothetical protein
LIPSTYLVDFKKINTDEIEEFIKKSHSEHFIFKPVNSTLSEGIFILKKEDIKEAISSIQNKNISKLKKLLEKYQTPIIPRSKLDFIAKFWMEEENSFAIIQSYCFAAPIQVKDKTYFSSKGRAVILVINNEVTVVDIFFHAPKINNFKEEKFVYSECVIGGEVDTVYFNPEKELYSAIESILQKELPIIFEKASAFDLQSALLEAIKNKDQTEIRYLLTACSMLAVGEYKPDYLDIIKENLSTSTYGESFLDFLVTQTSKYFLGNEERENYRPLFDLLLPNLSLLNTKQLKILLLQKDFVLTFWKTEEFTEFFKKLKSYLEKLEKSLPFSLGVTRTTLPVADIPVEAPPSSLTLAKSVL